MIRPVEALRDDFKSIADFCNNSSKPVCLTENGEGAFVLMSLASYKARLEQIEEMETTIAVLESMLDYYEDGKSYTLEEVDQQLREVIDKAGAAE